MTRTEALELLGLLEVELDDLHTLAYDGVDERVKVAQLEWRDPPTERTGGWVDRLAPVMQRPGVWALVRTFSRESSGRGAVRDLRRGHFHRPPGEWEFKCSRSGPEAWSVFARYVGPDA